MLPLTELGHGRQGQPNKKGEVKQASSPHVGVEGQWFTTTMQNAPTYREVPTPIIEEWLYTPLKQPNLNDRARGHAP